MANDLSFALNDVRTQLLLIIVLIGLFMYFILRF